MPVKLDMDENFLWKCYILIKKNQTCNQSFVKVKLIDYYCIPVLTLTFIVIVVFKE